MTIAAGTTFAFTVPAIVPGNVYALARYDASTSTWSRDYAGPATINGTTLTITLASAVTIAPGQSLVVALYTTAAATPTPTWRLSGSNRTI